MRYAILFVMFSMGFWSLPPIEVSSASDVRGLPVVPLVTTQSLRVADADGPQILTQVGRDSLVFAVAPKLDTVPVLPDWPIRLSAVALDKMPKLPGPVVHLEQVELTSAVIGDATGSSPVQGAAEPSVRTGRVVALSLNMRSGPAKRYPVVAALRQGERALYLGESRNGWVRVRMENSGTRGWVFQKYITHTEG